MGLLNRFVQKWKVFGVHELFFEGVSAIPTSSSVSFWSSSEIPLIFGWMDWRQFYGICALLWLLIEVWRILYGNCWNFHQILLCWSSAVFERLQRITLHDRVESFDIVFFNHFNQLVMNLEVCLEETFKQFEWSGFLSKVGIIVLSDFGSLEILLTLLLKMTELMFPADFCKANKIWSAPIVAGCFHCAIKSDS